MNTIDRLSSLGGLTQTNDSSKTDVNDGLFSSILEESIAKVNEAQVSADKAAADIATGEVRDLHQAAIAIGKAETNMKLMLEVRNKALSAYKEILRTQI